MGTLGRLTRSERASIADATRARQLQADAITLAPYQRRFVADSSRFRAIVKARRCGGSFAAAYSAALRVLGLRMTGSGIECDPAGSVPQRFISHSEEGAQELLAETHGLAERFAADGLCPGVTVGDLAATHFEISNGADASAHAGDGRTTRGRAGDVTLDEFAYARDPVKLWAAVKSVSDPTLKRPAGYRVTVVTTPWVADSLPHLVCVAPSEDDDRFDHFSRYSWPLSHVVTQDFPRRMTPDEQRAYVETMRLELGDDDVFETEYEGAWLSAAEMFLEREMLQRARYDAQDLPATCEREVAGVDVARRGKHLTAIARVRVARDERGRLIMWALPVDTLRGVEFATQEEAFAKVIAGGVTRLAIDATGIGMAPSEALAKRFPGKITPVTFTQQSKEEMASTLRLALEEGRLLLPHSPELLRDLASLRRIAQPGGGFRYDASDKGGSHADRAWALALAVSVASTKSAAAGVTAGAPMASHSMGRTSPMSSGGWRGGGF
jgi:phage FluMu gp28-like protein